MKGRVAVGGAAGPASVIFTSDALSLWGGFDPATGLVIDTHHPLRGLSLSGRIVVMPAGRGSSTSSAILLESVRAGTAPAGFMFRRLDPIFAIGSLVAEKLYGRAVPIVIVEDEGAFSALAAASEASWDTDGFISVR
jgi:predicted aconitase with swiveling domain